MNGRDVELRRKFGDSEKITINVGFVDLGRIDLVVEEAFYSNRSDFIRTAIRNQLDRHAEQTRQAVTRGQLELGLRRFSRRDLETAADANEKLHIRVLGLARIDDDVPPELADRTIASIRVLGALQMSPAVRAALADRIH
jgi:Arc/MetJ-type ribon-helix-helix transcriptional regulator